jgi:hypothetical protein
MTRNGKGAQNLRWIPLPRSPVAVSEFAGQKRESVWSQCLHMYVTIVTGLCDPPKMLSK